MNEKNLFQKINEVKNAISKANLKKSWKNSFAKFEYYELSDFLPLLNEICDKNWIFNHISFEENKAVLEIINCDNPAQVVKYEVPTCELELKGCNKIQALGGVQTYSRRYLYITAYDICENDSFDAVTWDWDKNEKKEKSDFSNEDLEKITISTLEKNKTVEEFIEKCRTVKNISKEMEEKIKHKFSEVANSLFEDAK